MAWTIDPSHSQAQFTVRHMMISNVRGRFEDFTGTVDFNENDLSTLKVDVSIDANSINTRDEKRDGHLRSADFFNVEEFPTLTFKSTGVEVVDNDNLKVQGDLTIRGISKPVTLDVEYNGVANSPWGTTSAGFSAHTKINRKEWDLTWNQGLETGGLLVGEDVKIELELELVKEQVAAESEAAA
jgi:polyisoprenoid-binding protein YceI